MSKKVLFSLALFSACMSAVFAEPAAGHNQTNQQTANSPSPNQLHARMRDAFHKQISAEQYSSNLYLTFATYCSDLGLEGCEKFFREAAKDETEHAYIFFNFLVDRGEKFQMGTVNSSAIMPTSLLDVFQKHLENEILVTKSIHNLYKIALEENDYASLAFLHPLLLMQVEEEKEATDLVLLLQKGANDPGFVISFDTKLLEDIKEKAED